jgi:hypothetical protein
MKKREDFKTAPVAEGVRHQALDRLVKAICRNVRQNL